MEHRKISERVQFDDNMNLVIVDGKKITAELLEAWTLPTPPAQWFRVELDPSLDKLVIHRRYDTDFQ